MNRKDSVLKMQFQVMAPLLMFLVFTLMYCLPAFGTDWETFSPPSKEFTIMLPVGIQKITNQGAPVDAEIYSSSDAGINYLIEDGVEVDPFNRSKRDEFVQGVTDGMMDKLKSQGVNNAKTEVVKVKGKGWHGEKTSLIIDGKKTMTVVVAFANNDDVAYTVMATADDSNPKVSKFLESLTVDPEIASQAHQKNSVAFQFGRNIGQIMFWAVLLGVLLGMLGLVLFLVARATKKK